MLLAEDDDHNTFQAVGSSVPAGQNRQDIRNKCKSVMYAGHLRQCHDMGPHNRRQAHLLLRGGVQRCNSKRGNGHILTQAVTWELVVHCRWFIFADICLMVQYIYYGSLQRRHERHLSRQWTDRRRHAAAQGASCSEEVKIRHLCPLTLRYQMLKLAGGSCGHLHIALVLPIRALKMIVR